MVLSAKVCARLEVVVVEVERRARADGLPLPAEVREALDAILAAGRAYRSGARAALDLPAAVDGSCGSAAADPSAKVGPMTTKAVAELLGTGERNVRDLAQRGALAGRLAGRTWRFDVVDVSDYLDSRQEAS